MIERYTPDFLRERLYNILAASEAILVYFFGSQFKGQTGSMSDIDLAVLWQDNEQEPMMKSLALQEIIKDKLNDERIEIGPLNGQSLSFCYIVINSGICIFGEEERRVEYETHILNEYFDFSFLAEKYNLVFEERILGERKHGQ